MRHNAAPQEARAVRFNVGRLDWNDEGYNAIDVYVYVYFYMVDVVEFIDVFWGSGLIDCIVLLPVRRKMGVVAP